MTRYAIIIFFCISLLGCKKSEPAGESCTVEITHQFRNPYTLSAEVMLTGKKPTHQYVKFQLYNISQYRALEEKGVFLLDHPFDANPDKNLQYKSEHTQQYGVYYGIVPSSVNLSAYESEKISDLDMSEANPAGRNSAPKPRQFEGTITFFDPVDSIQKPLKGLQIIIKDFTKTAIGFTDQNGHFAFSTPGIVSDTAEVLVRFDNDYLQIHTLDAGDLFGVFSTNTFSLGFRKSCAFTNLNIEIGRQFYDATLQHSCAALLSLNEFKDFAANNGFLMPTKKFYFWLGKEAPISTSYATPMLHNMTQQNISNPTQLISNLFGIPEDIADLLSFVIGDQLPDIYAPYYMRYATTARASFIETMFHELSHASHFAKVGTAFWLPYVEYIYGNGGYGTPDLANSGIVGVSEAWAEDLSNIGLNYIYNKPKYLGYNEDPIEDWIPYGLYHDLNDTGTNESFDNLSGISFPQIYSQLTVDTRSLATMKAKLKASFPAQQVGIDSLFSHYSY